MELKELINDEELYAKISPKLNGLSTPVDWVRQDNPDLTEIEAKEKIERNKKYNKENEAKFSKPVSRLEQIAREGVNS